MSSPPQASPRAEVTIKDVPRLLRIAADQIEQSDRRIKIILERIEHEKIFVGVLMRDAEPPAC